MDASRDRDVPQWLDASTAFADHKGNHKPRIEKRQRKMLAKLPHLARFLEEGEQVKWVTTGCSPTPILEQLTTGWIVFYINRALLVFTDRRILHVPTTYRYGYRDSIAEIRYADCRDIRVKGRNLAVRYANGKRERFLFIPRAERRRIKELFRDMTFSAATAPPERKRRPGRRHLCPRCTEALLEAVYECRGCRLAFKDMAAAVRLSIVVPGGGYFYTRHPWLGIGDFIVEAFLLVYVILFLSQAINTGDPALWFSATFFGFILVLEKLITIYHARRYIHEYIPREQPVKPQATAA